MATIRLPNNWQPRPYQRKLWSYLEAGGKRALPIWHRRAGKDDVFLHWTACASTERVGTYWYMLPEASQARKAIWEAINPETGIRRVNEAFPLPIREVTRENEMFMRLKSGSTWQVVGSDNYDSLVGSPPVGVVFSEWPISNPAAWAYLRPIFAQNGGWAGFNGTPRGKNHAHRMHVAAKDDPSWFTEILNADQTGVFTPETLASERAELIREHGDDVGEALFQQEYYCSFESAVLGAYYAKQLTHADRDGRICKVPYDPSAVVNTAWDLGHRDATAVWFWQDIGRACHVIDYYEAKSTEIAEDADVLRSKPYKYGVHYLPHDGANETKLPGKSIQGALAKLGYRTTVLPNAPGAVTDGINAARMLLPICYFDEIKCAAGLDALRSYRTSWDPERRVLGLTPVHDWASHGADAFRYLAMARKPRQKPVTHTAQRMSIA